MDNYSNFEICNDPDKLINILEKGATYVQEFTKSIDQDGKSVIAFVHSFALLTNSKRFRWHTTPMQYDFLVKFRDSYKELTNDIEKANMHGEGHLYMHFTNHLEKITAEFGWESDREKEHRFVWDRITSFMDIPVIAFSICFQGFQKLAYQFSPDEDEDGIDENEDEIPMFNFHPMRFYEYRHYTNAVLEYYIQYVDEDSGNLDIDDQLNLSSILMDAFNEEYRERPKRYIKSQKDHGFSIESTMSLATAHARFQVCGSQIFTISQRVIDNAKSIDLNAIKLRSLNVPFYSLYIHFGPQKNLSLDPGWLVDGMYVERLGDDGEVKFTLTAFSDEKMKFIDWVVNDEPNFMQEIVEDEFLDLSLEKAMDGEQASKMENYEELNISHKGEIIMGMIDESLAEMGLNKPGVNIPPIAKFAKEMIKKEDRRMEILSSNVARRYNVYKEAMKITVSALMELSTSKEVIRQEYLDSAPKELTDLLELDDEKAQEAFLELMDLGYYPFSLIE